MNALQEYGRGTVLLTTKLTEGTSIENDKTRLEGKEKDELGRYR